MGGVFLHVFGIILAVIAGIILLICAVLSIKLKVEFFYHDKVFLNIKWTFLKFNILPAGEKKPKKEKEKPKKEEPAPAEQPKQEKSPKQKKPNPIKTFLSNKGLEGLYEILYQTCLALGGFFSKIFKKIKFEELCFYMTVGTGDSALTAIEYGKISSVVFPMLGYICSHAQVGKYDIDISPDFLAEKSDGSLYAVISFRPLVLTNAVVVLVFKLLFKVLIKFLSGIKTPKGAKKNQPDSGNKKDSSQNGNSGENISLELHTQLNAENKSDIINT